MGVQQRQEPELVQPHVAERAAWNEDARKLRFTLRVRPLPGLWSLDKTIVQVEGNFHFRGALSRSGLLKGPGLMDSMSCDR